MAKKIRISPGWELVAVILLSGALISFFLYRDLAQKEVVWEQYQQAQFCQDKATCRQTLTATIVSSQTWQSITNAPGKNSSARRFYDTEYRFEIDSANGRSETVVSPLRPADEQLFDKTEIYIPSATDSLFAEQNFAAGKQIEIESWNGLVTFIFTNSIQGYAPDDAPTTALIFPLSDKASNQAASMPAGSSSGNVIAIPTTNHPLIALSKAQQDFTGAITATLFIGTALILLVIRFSKL